MKNYIILLSVLILASCSNQNKQNEVLNLYSKRHYNVDKELFAKFEEENNIKVNVVKASSDELIERIKTEGENCPADLLITVDAGKLFKAANENLLEKINVEDIQPNIKPELKDPNNYWLPITYRARVLAYNPEKVNPNELSSYEDLTKDVWKNRILVRTSTNAYNQALMSSIVAHLGEEYALDWANNMVNNFAREPKGNDRDQIRAIVAGVGDVAIVNSYYVGLLLSSIDSLDRNVGESVKVFFPNQGNEERGSHINISGIGLLKNAPNKENAIKFMKFLTSDYAQKYYTNNSFEYPVNSEIKPSKTIADWGNFKIDTLDLNQLGIKRKLAVEIFEKSNWK